MKKIAFLLCFALAAAAAFASGTSLYLNNQPYNKPVFSYKGQVFVSLEDIASALNLKLVNQGRVMCAAPAGTAGNPCPPDVSTAILYLNGKPVTQGISLHHGKVWLSIAAIGNALGYYYDYNPVTGIADLAAPPSARVSAPEAAPAAAAAASKGKAAPAGKNAITAGAVSIYMDPQTYEVRSSFNVVNVSDQPVNGVTATLQYLDGNGKPLNAKTFAVGTMQPGQSVTESDYWINSSEIVVTGNVILDWQGKNKKQ